MTSETRYGQVVTLKPVTPPNQLAGYVAVIVERSPGWDDGEPDEREIRTIPGSYCDAYLIARTRAIREAERLGLPYHED